jgi:hypothetical protein
MLRDCLLPEQPAGVLVEVGYMGYLAPMPPPVVSTPTGICSFHLLGISNQVYGGVHATTQVLHRNSGRSIIFPLLNISATSQTFYPKGNPSSLVGQFFIGVFGQLYPGGDKSTTTK